MFLNRPSHHAMPSHTSPARPIRWSCMCLKQSALLPCSPHSQNNGAMHYWTSASSSAKDKSPLQDATCFPLPQCKPPPQCLMNACAKTREKKAERRNARASPEGHWRAVPKQKRSASITQYHLRINTPTSCCLVHEQKRNFP